MLRSNCRVTMLQDDPNKQDTGAMKELGATRQLYMSGGRGKTHCKSTKPPDDPIVRCRWRWYRAMPARMLMSTPEIRNAEHVNSHKSDIPIPVKDLCAWECVPSSGQLQKIAACRHDGPASTKPLDREHGHCHCCQRALSQPSENDLGRCHVPIRIVSHVFLE